MAVVTNKYAVTEADGTKAVMYVADGADVVAELNQLHGVGAVAHPIDDVKLEAELAKLAPDATLVDYINAHHAAADTTVTVSS